MNAGTDCTDEFTAIHSRKAWAALDRYAIGTLKAGGELVVEEEATGGAKTTLKKKARVSLKLQEREQLSSDSFRLRFALPSPEHVLGLPIGQHTLIYGKDVSGRMVARALVAPRGNAVTPRIVRAADERIVRAGERPD